VRTAGKTQKSSFQAVFAVLLTFAFSVFALKSAFFSRLRRGATNHAWRRCSEPNTPGAQTSATMAVGLAGIETTAIQSET
jgi:hypothetical protein